MSLFFKIQSVGQKNTWFYGLMSHWNGIFWFQMPGEKHIQLCVLFVFVVFVCSLGFSAPEYVHCEHRVPDEMLDHAGLTDQSAKGPPHFAFFVAPILLDESTVHWSPQGFPPPRSYDPSVHSRIILSTVIRI